IAMLLGKGLMVSEGDYWKRQRRMIQPTFRRESLAWLTELILASNRRLADRWTHAAERNEPVDVADEVNRLTLEIALRSTFGDDYDAVRGHFEMLADDTKRDVHFAEGFRATGQLIAGLVSQRRQDRRERIDFLACLMSARDADSGDAM